MSTESTRPTVFHVSPKGSDDNPGTAEAPFCSIQHASDVAQPGDTITVHEGVYRERINPPRGGDSEETRITYQAAPGEQVSIKGSERIQNWQHLQEDVWTTRLPETFFGGYNPYRTEVTGNWFRPLPDLDRVYHTGAVYLNGHWLKEAASKEALFSSTDPKGQWIGEAGEKWTTLTARFPGEDPNQALVEINVREAVFYPDQPGRNYIHVRGFTLEHAACNWAPPTAEQVGLIGTHWSRGWIIEENRVQYAMCSGITLGKYGDEWDNRAESAEGYVGTIRRAHEQGWRRGTIGHHLIQHNEVCHCEQAGIVGSMGCAFSVVRDNHVHHINNRDMFTGEEMAGIKFHGAIDSLLENNHVHHCGGFGGMWLDWMAQGTRVRGNLFHDNDGQDLFVEVNHGPFMVDHNLFLSPTSLLESSGGGAYVHNLFAGRITLREEPDRDTPCHPPHSTDILKLSKVIGEDERFYNNLFTGGNGLMGYLSWTHTHLHAQGNMYLGTAGPGPVDQNHEVLPEVDASPLLEETGGEWRLHITFPSGKLTSQRRIMTSEQLPPSAVSGAVFESPEGMPYRLDSDYVGQPHAEGNPLPGPFAEWGSIGLATTIPVLHKRET